MQFAILISVLVALLLGAFLLLTHVQSVFKIKSKELVLAFEQSNMQLFSTLDHDTTSNDTVRLVSEHKVVKQITNYHGAWTKNYSQVGVHGRKVARIAFTGSKLTSMTPNLYLENTNSPLVIVGNTRLEGNNYLPKQGIKAGNISGNYYRGTNLYYGRALESKTFLPKLKKEWVKYLDDIVNGAYIDKGIGISLEKELKNSFHKPIQTVYDFEPIFIEDQKITGNIVIQSKTAITIGQGSQLKDVLLIAPKIIVKDGVKGSFQVVATKTIHIGKKCYLSYPSAIVLLDKSLNQAVAQQNQVKNAKPDLMINSGSVLEGSVVYLMKNQNQKTRIKTHIAIEPSVEVIGEVYCQGNIDFQGIIKGSMYTRQCIARQSGSIYLNHIYNGKILMNPIQDYSGLPFSNSKNNVTKWLY